MWIHRSPTSLLACTLALVSCSGPIGLANVLPVQLQLPTKKSSESSSGRSGFSSAGAAGFALAGFGFAAASAAKDVLDESAKAVMTAARIFLCIGFLPGLSKTRLPGSARRRELCGPTVAQLCRARVCAG